VVFLLIKSEFDIQFQLPLPTAMVAMLHVHPSVEPLLKTGDALQVQQWMDKLESGLDSGQTTC